MTQRQPLEPPAPADKLRLRILAPTRRALALAQTIAQDRGLEVDIWQRPGALPEEIQTSLARQIPTLAICALGIIARTLSATTLPNKVATAPLICASEDGAFFIPVLGGHSSIGHGPGDHRGANALAQRLAGLVGGQAVVTTVSDGRFSLALDQPPAGWALHADPQTFSHFLQDLLDQGGADLSAAPDWIKESELTHVPNSELKITWKRGQPLTQLPKTLIYYPKDRLALGLGCVRGCPPEKLEALIAQAERKLGYAIPRSCSASILAKQDEPAFAQLFPDMRFFSAAELDAVPVPNPSSRVRAEVGTGSVAEAAALLRAGGPQRGARLVLPKITSAQATLALAFSPEPMSADTRPGQGRARLAIVGLGPGAPALTTAQSQAALNQADLWVGYRRYLDQAERQQQQPHKHEHRRCAFALGEEEARCRAALDAAAKGQRVALVCSGDPQIYAMAQVVHELLARHGGREEWQRVFVETVPGITAMQALAARVGAPLGHDFCAISLSDLNTPWDAIESKVQAAAQADFVVGFYNPRSQQRDWQLPRALDILRAHRPGSCPLALGRHVGRPGETIVRTTLADLDPEQVDMSTCLIVGASFTQRHRDYIFTPRGYALGRGTAGAGK